MQKRNIKMLVLSAALATTAAFAVAKQQQNFTDIPAGHWASEAVQAIAAEGLITGYQDGTFKGQRTLTRYEAATIFYRLLKSGKLAQATPATQTTTQQGMAEVSPELTALQTQATETGTRLTALEDQIKTLSAAPAGTAPAADVDARIKAVEDEIAALKAAPAATGTTPAATTSPELETRIKTLEDELAALKTAAAAPASTATPAASSDLEARLKALEDKVAATPAAPAAPATSSDTDARLKALEDKVAALPTAAPAAGGDVTALTATVTAQETRIATLESALTKLQTDVNGLKATAATPPATTTTTMPVTTGSSATDTTNSGPTTRIAFGIGGAANITGPGVGAGFSPFGLYGQLGIANLAGPFGIRAFADLSSVPAAGAQIMLNFGDGGALMAFQLRGGNERRSSNEACPNGGQKPTGNQGHFSAAPHKTRLSAHFYALRESSQHSYY